MLRHGKETILCADSPRAGSCISPSHIVDRVCHYKMQGPRRVAAAIHPRRQTADLKHLNVWHTVPEHRIQARAQSNVVQEHLPAPYASTNTVDRIRQLDRPRSNRRSVRIAKTSIRNRTIPKSCLLGQPTATRHAAQALPVD